MELCIIVRLTPVPNKAREAVSLDIWVLLCADGHQGFGELKGCVTQHIIWEDK